MKNPKTNKSALIGFGHFSSGKSTSHTSSLSSKGLIASRVTPARLSETSVNSSTVTIKTILKIRR